MQEKLKKWIETIKKLPMGLIACLFLIATCVLSLGIISINPSQSLDASLLTASFSGEYKIENGDWQPITDGGHISATQGKVTLRGKFIVLFPNGEFLTDNPSTLYPKEPEKTEEPYKIYINFYCNHISVQMRVGGNTEIFEAEHPQIGTDACGAIWASYRFPEGTDGVVEIVISNPHKYGNESAIDEFLDSIRMDDPTLLGDELAKQYDTFRYVGFAFVAIALVVFVLSVVAFVAKLNIAKSLWIIGFWILFTGGFYIFDVADVFFWIENASFTTTALCLCQILSNLFLSLFTTNYLSGKKKEIASILQLAVGAITFVFVLLSLFGVVRMFDIRFVWYILYALHALILGVFCIQEMRVASKGIRFILLSCMACMLGLLIDFFGVSFALWDLLYLSKFMFGGMLVILMSFGIYAIISSYKLSMRAKEMETELKDTSIAVMISQIQPHFLYNSLNSIAELCVVDPKRAEKATIDFSRYLRGNMGALNEKKTIEFEDELSHLSHYIELEKLRYGDDLQFEYDIREKAFTLPALTVQPLVENAVNHGIRYHKMKGKVKISSYSDDKNYFVSIEDDGVGFDPNDYQSDGRKHVGIANVKYRLDVLCGGSVDIKSQKGVGTVVTIRIPKEKE